MKCWYNLQHDKPWKQHIMWKELIRKDQIKYNTIYKKSRTDNSIHMQNRLVIARDQGKEGMESDY